jgi:hypothetical protein
VVLFLVLVSTVPELARLSMILVGQRTLQELVSVRKTPLRPTYPCNMVLRLQKLDRPNLFLQWLGYNTDF